MAIILDHTSSGNIFLKGFSENLNPYPNLKIENGGILGYLNGFPIQYIAAYDNGNSYTWGNIVSAGNKYWLRIGEPNPGYPPYEGSPYWKLYTIESPTYIFEAFGGNSYLNVYLNQFSGQSPLPEIQDEDFGGFLIEESIIEENSEQIPEININFSEEANGGNEILISGSTIDSVSNLSTQLSSKENFISLGNVWNQNTGISQNDIVVIEQFPDNSITINPSLISSYAIKDTFKINDTGELINLYNADIGDVAINLVNTNFYILSCNESQAYLNINNWIAFSGFAQESGQELALYVNTHAPNGLGNVDIDSNEIDYCVGCATISDKISETNIIATGLLQNYQKCNLFLNQTGNYSLLDTFDDIASTKICSCHEHEITEIINLSGRLEILKFLNSGDLVNSQRSYSYFLGNQNFTYSCNSLILGQYGLSCYNSEIVYTPSHLNTVDTGNFQSSIILGSGCTNSDACISLKQINMNQYNYHFVVANIVGRSDDCQICAAYDLYGALARQDGSIFKIQNTACEVKGEELNIDFNSISTNLYSLDLTGYLNKSMKWFSKINVISIQDTGYNLFIGTE